jgi:two-component system, chemotaxis family, protein-glutamate methylesterase/glutaminase
MISNRGHDIVVIGASAGGVEALMEVTQRLPSDLPAALFVVLHLPRDSRSNLPEILSRSGPLPAKHAKDREAVQRGRIYIAPPDLHMLLDEGFVRLWRGPHHNWLRPGVDPLFESAARAYGSRVVGVVLSGALDDGTAGLARIKRAGGIAIVQDPSTAPHPGMPESARAYVAVDRTVPIRGMAAAIDSAVREPVPERAAAANAAPGDEEEWSLPMSANSMEGANGKPAVYACPECHGTLWEHEEDDVLRFRCRVGHTFSSEGLLHGHDGDLDATLWAALRALEENASLRRRLARRMRTRQVPALAERYETHAEESERHAGMLRTLLTSEPASSAGSETSS